MKRKRLLLILRNSVSKTKSFFQRMLSDTRSGDVSSKRVIGVVGFVSLLIIMFINALWSKSVAPVEYLVNAIEYIVIAAMFGTVVDKFSNQKQKQDDEPAV
jgi:uncharacterized protein (DUF983 family)